MNNCDWISGDPLPVEPADLLEADIQDKCVTHARHHGAWARKFSSPANRSVPDYIFCWQGGVWFVEFKRKGKRPTKQQYEEHAAIREAGGAVWVCDDIVDFKQRFGHVRNTGMVLERKSDYPANAHP